GLTRKGSRRHVRSGRLFYRAITVVFVTAPALAIMRWREDYHLFIIGAVAFAAATIGYQHRIRRRAGDTGHIVGMGVSYVAMLTAFYVDNGPHLPLSDRLPPLTFSFLPRAIGMPIITRAVLAARKHSSRVASSARASADGAARAPRQATFNHPFARRSTRGSDRRARCVARTPRSCAPEPTVAAQDAGAASQHASRSAPPRHLC